MKFKKYIVRTAWVMLAVKGRMNRLHMLIHLLVSTIYLCVAAFIIVLIEDRFGKEMANQFSLVTVFPLFWFTVAASVKRAHDLGKSGKGFAIGLYVPIINLYVLYSTYFVEGTLAENKYGPIPIGYLR